MEVFEQRPAVLKIIEFSHRHRWSKYFCVAAVSVIYAHDCTEDLIFRSRKRAAEYFRENRAAIPAKIFSGVTAAAFAVMTIPFSAAAEGAQAVNESVRELGIELARAAYSDEFADTGLPKPVDLSGELRKGELPVNEAAASPDISGNNGSDDNDPGLPAVVDHVGADTIHSLYEAAESSQMLYIGETTISSVANSASDADTTEALADSGEDISAAGQYSVSEDEADSITDDEYAEAPVSSVPMTGEVFVSGLPEEDDRYSVVFCYEGSLRYDITVEMKKGTESDRRKVCEAFEAYSIDTDMLNIVPFDLNLYDADGRHLKLRSSDTAEVVIPIPAGMENHRADMKVVRVEDGRIDILDSDIFENESGGLSVRFVTDRFSVFALVAYTNEPEDIQSSAGAFADADMAASSRGLSIPDIFREKRRGKKSAGKKYRIVRKMCKKDIIF